MDFRRTIIGLCLPVLVLLLAAADKPDQASASFVSDAQLRYAMDFADAQSSFTEGGKDWVVLYNVDTPSTNEFAWVFQEREFYMLRFYQGRCYFIERRVEVPVAEVESVFKHYTERLGETPEGTMSRDQSLWYSHWMLKDRDVELTATLRENESYLLTYQEFDPLLMGEALRTQESELASQPSEVDPLTGKPRPSTHETSGEGTAGTDEDTSGTSEDVAGEGAEGAGAGNPGSGEETKPAGDGQEGQPEANPPQEEQPKEDPAPPPDDGDEPDWY